MIFLTKIYRFLASVKLAIPVMLALLVGSVTGTILESRYNTEYAGIVIYKSWWFLIILFLLGINITFATFTRLPWKKRHLGFLVTHLGMLILLFGSVLTMQVGIDGTMQIAEGGDSNLVFLQKNVIEIDGKKIYIPRLLEKADLSSNKELNQTELKFSSYLPFVEVPEKNFDRGVNVNFKIKSAFFDVTQILNNELDKEVKMGPATFRIVDTVVAPEIKKPNKSEKKSEKKSVGKVKGAKLILKDTNGNVVSEIALGNKSKLNYKDLEIEIIHVFNNAQIINNKIGDGDPSGSNPAVELQVKQGAKSGREILYQNIPEFSLNPNGLFGIKFSYNSGAKGAPVNLPTGEMPMNHGEMAGIGGAPTSGNRQGNTVEFRIVDQQQNIVEVALYKGGEELMKKTLKKDEMFTTPWMGIEVTFKGFTNPTDPFVPTESEPKSKMPLPESAILTSVGTGNDRQQRWITENTEFQISKDGKATNVYYGRERLFLPFSVALEKFEKKDYPGSSMAMGYKSFVKINGKGETKEIYMNEPLKFEGYTLYQSSYQMNPNGPAITILSVNRDPGRVFKYMGSIILCLGIILYTFQKSRRFKDLLN